MHAASTLALPCIKTPPAPPGLRCSLCFVQERRWCSCWRHVRQQCFRQCERGRRCVHTCLARSLCCDISSSVSDTSYARCFRGRGGGWDRVTGRAAASASAGAWQQDPEKPRRVCDPNIQLHRSTSYHPECDGTHWLEALPSWSGSERRLEVGMWYGMAHPFLTPHPGHSTIESASKQTLHTAH